MLGVVKCYPCVFLVVVIINSQLVASQVKFTSHYNGSVVIGYLHSTVNFTWTFTGGLLLADWGTKKSGVIDIEKELVSLNKNGQVPLNNVPSLYRGRVNGSWDGKTPGHLKFALRSIKEEDDNKMFVCRMSPENFAAPTAYDTVQLAVRDPPEAQLVNPVSKVVDARVGSSASFTCNASGMPLPSIRWMRQSGSSVNVIAADNVKYQVIPSSGSSQLIVKNISFDDQGYYICNASSFESNLDTVFLGVISLIPSTESCPGTIQNALRGVPTTICCPVRGFPPPDVTWTLPDGTVQKTGNTILPITPKTNDFGKYTCSAEGLKETDPDPVIVSINLQEEGLKKSITAKNNTQLRGGEKFKWSVVKGARSYICRVRGADIESTSLLGDNQTTSIEILHSELNFKDPNKKPDPVKVVIEVLAIGESDVIGRGGPFAAEISAAASPGLSFILSAVLFVSALSLQ